MTIKDVAREAGVSVSLVSFVMNNRVNADGKPKYRVGEETRQRILEVARQLQYKPAERVLKRALRSLVAGVILPDPLQPACSAFASQLERLAQIQGFTLLYGYSQDEPVRFARLCSLFLQQKVAGLVVLPPADEQDPLEDIRQSGIPYVVPSGMEDAFTCACDCVERLVRLTEEKEKKLNLSL